MINTSQNKLTVCSPGLHGQHSCHKWPRRMLTHGTGGSPTFAGRCRIFKHPLLTKMVNQTYSNLNIPDKCREDRCEYAGCLLDEFVPSACSNTNQGQTQRTPLTWWKKRAMQTTGSRAHQLGRQQRWNPDGHGKPCPVKTHARLGHGNNFQITSKKLQVKSYRLKITS